MAILNKRKKVFASLLLILLVLGCTLFTTVYFMFLKPINIKLESTTFYINRDDNIDSVYIHLQESLQKPTPYGFKLLSTYKKYPKQIHTGKYTITNQDTSYSLFLKLFRGNQTPTKLVINNVRTLDQLAQKVGDQLMIESFEIQHYFDDIQFLDSLGYTKETLPALFIPNTYEVYWNIEVEDFFKRMGKEHLRFWNEERTKLAQEIGLSAIEVATLASIVEEETNANDEKPMVAGLYMNRLKRGMPLQADPTIKFALQDFAIKRITNKDLEVDSPYNTYIHTGLPPGPIRFASIQGLESVLNYSKHNYLYMCAKEDFSGKHNFATNLNDHMVNARKYWRALNQRKIYKLGDN